MKIVVNKKSTFLSNKYKDFENVFDKKNVDKFFKHDSQNHVIKTKSDKMFSFDFVYNLFNIKFKILKINLKKNLEKKFIIFFFYRKSHFIFQKF